MGLVRCGGAFRVREHLVTGLCLRGCDLRGCEGAFPFSDRQTNNPILSVDNSGQGRCERLHGDHFILADAISRMLLYHHQQRVMVILHHW